jgi:CheY-like chemotaxis protein
MDTLREPRTLSVGMVELGRTAQQTLLQRLGPFPSADGAFIAPRPARPPSTGAGATEVAAGEATRDGRSLGGERTVLVVDDQPEVLMLLGESLRMLGYRVLEAARPSEGLRVGEQHTGPIDLLLTDIVLPEMNGTEFARRLLDRRPEARVLYLSGYGAEDLSPLGVPVEGLALLRKPFTLDTLGRSVRGALGEANP